MPTQRKGAALTALLALAASFAPMAAALDFTFCSTDNTGNGTPTSDPFMSNGKCFTTCQGSNFAFAITQGFKCWCSNAEPGAKASRGTCSTGCPGFTEFCGGPDAFSYIKISEPQSTDDSSSKKPTTTPPPSSTTGPKTSAMATTGTDGVVKTIIVTLQPTASSDSGGGGGGLGTGGIVGIVVGVVGGILVIGGALLFFFMRKRKQKKEENYQGSAGGSASGSRHGRGSPSSPGSAGNHGSMLQIDPRMDPFQQGLYARSGSSESVNTLHDDHDYSRRIQSRKVLRATNPDPETAATAAAAAAAQ